MPQVRVPVLDQREAQALGDASIVVVQELPRCYGGDGGTDAKGDVAKADFQVSERFDALTGRKAACLLRDIPKSTGRLLRSLETG